MKFFKNLNSKNKIVNCPSCKQKLNVPVKAGKTLLITCTKCKAKFELRFVNPLSEVFSWNSKLSFFNNLRNFALNFTKLPMQGKLSIIILFLLFFFLLSSFTEKFKQPNNPPNISEEGISN